MGSGVSIENRWSVHLCSLRKGDHYNKYLQSTWKKYGEKSFSFNIVEKCPVARLTEREQFWIDRCKNQTQLFNLQPTARSNLGFKASLETKMRMRGARLKVLQNPEHQEINSLRVKEQHARGKFGRQTWSENSVESFKINIRTVKPREPVSEETRVKMREAWTDERKGEQAKRIIENVKGKHRRGFVWSEKQRKKTLETWTPEKRLKFAEMSRVRERLKKEGRSRT